MILFHDYCDVTIEILPALLDHINKLGLKIVRADELLNEKGYTEENHLPQSHEGTKNHEGIRV